MKRLISGKNQQKIAELRDSGQWCCINISSDYNYVWSITLIESSLITGNHMEHKPTLSTHSSDTLDEAVEDIYKKAKEYNKLKKKSKK